MNITLKEQLLYIIGNEELAYQEYYLPYVYYTNSHINAYTKFLAFYPELELDGRIPLSREFPEQLKKEGMVVYQGFGPINEEHRDLFYGFDHSAGLLLPQNLKNEQRKKLKKYMEQLREMYVEFTYYKDDKLIPVCFDRSQGIEQKYSTYQKLKSIVYSK